MVLLRTTTAEASCRNRRLPAGTGARGLDLEMDELPVLYLTDALAGGKGVTLKLPAWEEDELMRLFEAIFQAVHEAAGSGDRRMETVRENLKGYRLANIEAYLKQYWKENNNPKELVKAVWKFFTGLLEFIRKAGAKAQA